jgi:lysophospholipase L1-like esterase
MPHWVTSWTGSVQGPYPTGNPSAQPDLRFALPTETARDQTFRLNVRPSFWGPEARLRLSNAHGVQAVTFDDVHAGLQRSGSVVEPGTNRPVTFGGETRVTVPAGDWVWSDPVAIPPAMIGRRLAVSFHVAGDSGPMTWHAKALTTSYLTAPGAGAIGASDGVLGFSYSTTSWFFLDAVDMAAPSDTRLIVAFGDSITDGTGTTLNGDDRWPDVLLHRLLAQGIADVAIVNAGIGGNQVIGPPDYSQPFPGGMSALDRMERDVLSLSGVTHVIWLEGTNDFSANGNASAAAVIDGMTRGVARLRTRLPGVRVVGATVASAFGSPNPGHGDESQDEKRRTLNGFIRTGGLFDGVVDFDRATLDPATGGLRPEFVPDSTIGGPGDRLHPNRAGYQAMAAAIDLDTLLG